MCRLCSCSCFSSLCLWGAAPCDVHSKDPCSRASADGRNRARRYCGNLPDITHSTHFGHSISAAGALAFPQWGTKRHCHRYNFRCKDNRLLAGFCIHRCKRAYAFFCNCSSGSNTYCYSSTTSFITPFFVIQYIIHTAFEIVSTSGL